MTFPPLYRRPSSNPVWIAFELAAGRVPDLDLARNVSETRATLRDIAGEWRTSRIDVSRGTGDTHKVNLNRIIQVLGAETPDRISKADVSALVVRLHESGLARESITKTVATLAMVLDHAEIAPNPARKVRLPEKVEEDVHPPLATHVETAYYTLPTHHRLPTLVLDATGMRITELVEHLTWGDIDEHERRWRTSKSATKTRRSRWVPVQLDVFQAVLDLVPREDRDLSRTCPNSSTNAATP